MREIVESVNRWFDEGCEVVLACVVRTWGSSPRPAGSLMAISSDGRIAGSVSGGCIEGAVVQSALAAMEDGSWSVEQFHADTARAQEVGLSCGGNVDVAVMPYDPALARLEQAFLSADRTYVRLVGLLDGGDAGTGAMGTTKPLLVVPTAPACDQDTRGLRLVPVPGEEAWSVAIAANAADAAGEIGILKAASEALAASEGRDTGLLACGGASYFFQRMKGRPTVVCVGGTHVAVHLAALARVLGYRTVVIDPRHLRRRRALRGRRRAGAGVAPGLLRRAPPPRGMRGVRADP